MRVKHLIVALRLPILVATTASAALLIEYGNAGSPAFCSAGSGCAKVRASEYAKIGGIPLPIIGLAAFGILFALAVVSRTKLQHRVLALAGALGGLAGAALIVLQATAIQAFCKWCIAVDTSAIVAGVLGVLLALKVEREPEAAPEVAAMGQDFSLTLAWTVAGALSIALPFIWARYPVIQPLRSELVPLTVPDKINIISFTDFQCPFCRKLHPVLDELREQHNGEVHFVRKMVPLAGHSHAMPAALAWECVPEAARDRMADALYLAEPSALGTDTATFAQNLGVDKDTFDKCVADPATKAKVEADIALFKSIDGAGLPTTYVNDRSVAGNNPRGLEQAWAAAHEKNHVELPVPLMWVALAAAYLAASWLTLRKTLES
jgi:uncharacterized membrane protein